MRNTREMIREFNRAFERPVNESYTPVSVTERILLANLLFEEVREYIEKGLGLRIVPVLNEEGDICRYDMEHVEGRQLNPVEIVDGLADVNVVIHFNAHWHGFNLDEATEIVNDSNMSKLGPDGKPIINGVTPGYRNAPIHLLDENNDESIRKEDEAGFDPNKPIGKILKGPNFYEPQPYLIDNIIMREGGNRG